MIRQQNIYEFPITTGDANGNAIGMNDLTYAYENDNGNSNLLKNVSDAVSTQNTDGFVDGNTSLSLDDYEYDVNGNMILDRNKGIESIAYNHLNLPVKVTWSNKKYITYQYTAAGQKVKKTLRDNDSIKIVDYLDGFQYTGNVLQFFPHGEGYVKVSPNQAHSLNMFNYVFNYTDHLGNVRLSYTKDPQTGTLDIMDENHYYPFGLKHGIYAAGNLKDFTLNGAIDTPILEQVRKTEYNYKYQGQERQDELGLNWDSFKWRNYDYAIGRFMNIDPLSEQYHWQTHYAFSENRVIDGVELEGLERVPVNEVWNLGRNSVTASGVGNFDKAGPYKVTNINNNLVSMHLLTSGPNQGNWVGIEHTGGGIGNFFGAGQQSDGYSYEFKYVIGGDLVGSDREVSISNKDIAFDGVLPALLNDGKFSSDLSSVTLINLGDTHSFDSQTGELKPVPFNTVGDVINVAKDHFKKNHSLSDYLPSPKAKNSSSTKANTWHQFRSENKGKYTKENYGDSKEASKQRSVDYEKWKEKNGQ